MQTIEVDPDIYTHIAQNTSVIGESASAILRRLLGLTPAILVETASEKTEFQKMLGSPEFIYAKGVVGRFLVVLRWLHDQNPETFKRVEGVRGRGRLYFARDAATLEAAGRSVNPKEIAGTKYWVITTTPTDLKQEILSQVMRSLGYSVADINAATHAIAAQPAFEG